MPSSPENSDPASVQQAADQHAEEILARRRASRALRAAAIKAHSQPISIKTELSQAPLPGAVASTSVSASTQTAGYLLAVGDSWFEFMRHEFSVTNLCVEFMRQNLCVNLCVRRDWYFQNCFLKVPISSDAQIPTHDAQIRRTNSTHKFQELASVALEFVTGSLK